MKIAIVGAGAMGSLFAGYLAKTTVEVWIYDIWKEHIEAINKDGLCITNGKKSDRVRLNATSDPKVPGIATPFNSTMCGLIKAMEESYGKRLS